MLRRRPKRFWLMCLTLAGCQHAPSEAPTVLHPVVGSAWKGTDRWFYPEAKTSFKETGLAALVSHKPGYRTSDGEVWSAEAMTGAHQTLQLPLVVRVKNLQNGRVVRIRLNDRGPKDGRRILGMTPKVAALLGARSQPIPIEITPEQSRNEQYGFNDAARPHLDIEAPGRGAVVAQSLDGKTTRNYGADAQESTQRRSALMIEALPDIYQQDRMQPVSYKIILGGFFSRSIAVRLAARCAATVQRNFTDLSTPSWQVVYGPYLALEDADDGQLRAQNCGISNPRLTIE